RPRGATAASCSAAGLPVRRPEPPLRPHHSPFLRGIRTGRAGRALRPRLLWRIYIRPTKRALRAVVDARHRHEVRQLLPRAPKRSRADHHGSPGPQAELWLSSLDFGAPDAALLPEGDGDPSRGLLRRGSILRQP